MTDKIKSADAAAELLRRQRARGSLVEYAKAIDIPGAPVTEDEECEVFRKLETPLALHHEVILRHAQECIEDPQGGRLMIFAPPGSAKSTYISVVTPAWAMSRALNQEIIVTGYGDNLPVKHSRKIRTIIGDVRQQAIWPNKPALIQGNRAVNQWGMTNGSALLAAGILSGITGNRANGAIIDDPVKGREAADSPTIQDKTEEEYRDSVLTRLKPNGWVILIQTRWNEGDLSGRILPEDYHGQSGKVLCRDGRVWTILNIPAEAEHKDDPLKRKAGEFLWPEWFPEQHWLNFKRDARGQRTWASLFQQRPTAGDGIEFKREWFKRYDPDLPPGEQGGPPKHITLYGGSDFAAKEDRSADFTEHGVGAVDPKLNLYVLDWWGGQTNSEVYLRAWIQLVLRTQAAKGQRVIKWWDEGNVIGHAIAPARTRMMREANCWITTEQLPSIKSKAIKLASIQAWVAAGRVYLPLKRAWAEEIINQLCSFPAGRYDDKADVMGLFGRGLDEMAQPYIPSAVQKKSLVPYSAEWVEWTGDEDESNIRYT